MLNKNDILNFWGLGELKHFSLALPIIIVYFIFSLTPYDYRIIFINLVSLASIPVSFVIISNERKSFVSRKINFDKILPFILISNFDFVSIDELRYLIFALLYIILLNLPIIRYNFYKSRPVEIISKLTFATLLSLFIAQLIALGLLLLQISLYNK
ncbi:MAG: hypothetical protein WHV28_10430 [Bacteroidota bacterium]